MNAWWCYANFPVAVGFPEKQTETFSAWILPAGFMHGALLALATVFLTVIFLNSVFTVRLAGIVAVGWLAGWFSYIPLWLYMHSNGPYPEALTWAAVFDAVRWPLQHDSWEALYMPYMSFGLAAAVYYALLALIQKKINPRSAVFFTVIGSLSGVLGSLWWWMAFKPWWFSLLHGAIWGSLVGIGLWESQKKQPAS